MRSSFAVKRLAVAPEAAADTLRLSDGTPAGHKADRCRGNQGRLRSLGSSRAEEIRRSYPRRLFRENGAGAAEEEVSDIFCLSEVNHPSQAGSFG